MSRQCKAGSYVNVRLKESVYQILLELCEKEYRTKTSMIERALTKYFDELDAKQSDATSEAE